MQLTFALAALMLVLPACVAPQPAPSLDLRYTPIISSAPKCNITIFVETPRYVEIKPAPTEQEETETELGPADIIPQKYATYHAPRLQASLQADLRKILVANGCIVSKALGSFDELSPADKEQIDLVAEASIDFGPLVTNNQSIYRYPTGTVLVVNIGELVLAGTLTIAFREPVSGRIIMTRTITVSSLRANAPAAYEDQAEAENKLLLLLNKVYPQMLAAYEKNLKIEELQTALPSRKRLNNTSRPDPAESKPQ